MENAKLVTNDMKKICRPLNIMLSNLRFYSFGISQKLLPIFSFSFGIGLKPNQKGDFGCTLPNCQFIPNGQISEETTKLQDYFEFI